MVEETTAASHGLAGQAEDLNRLVGRFRLAQAGADLSVRGLAARLVETFPVAKAG